MQTWLSYSQEEQDYRCQTLLSLSFLWSEDRGSLKMEDAYWAHSAQVIWSWGGSHFKETSYARYFVYICLLTSDITSDSKFLYTEN